MPRLEYHGIEGRVRAIDVSDRHARAVAWLANLSALAFYGLALGLAAVATLALMAVVAMLGAVA